MFFCSGFSPVDRSELSRRPEEAGGSAGTYFIKPFWSSLILWLTFWC
jgi:hypothetical protein